jgi:Mn2+/Fe2+ NRAMP family transporter
MIQQEFCQTCEQKDDCRKVYRELGNSKSPSVAAQVVLAFLLPLLVFILTLGVSERILAGAMRNGHFLTVASFLLALFVTFAFIVIIKVVRR